MSGAPAYLPLFGSDYLADTSHLSTEEHGAYLLLMIAAWRQDDCGLPLDDKKLGRIVGLSSRKWAQIKDTILEFWRVENGRIYQPRLHKEWLYACKKSEGNRQNARKRWDAQSAENTEGDQCDRISDGNAPQPQPQREEVPNGTPSPPKALKAKPVKFAMTDDWQPGPLPDTVQALVDLWPPGRFEREVDQFRDYWADRTEKRPGWDRTFHNRIRDIHDRVLRDNHNGNRNQGYGGAAAGDRGTRVRTDGFTAAINAELARTGSLDPAEAAGRLHDDGTARGGELPLAVRPALR